jgi:type II secretory pathway component GspD/PulD (secretin)
LVIHMPTTDRRGYASRPPKARTQAWWLAVAAMAWLGGCAGGSGGPRGAVETSPIRPGDEWRDARARPGTATVEPPIRVSIVEPSIEAGEVAVSAASVPFEALLGALAREHGYSVVFVEGLGRTRPITVELRDLTPEAAMRRVAQAAGFALIIDRVARTATVSEYATHVFRLPLHAMQRLSAQYAVGGSPTVQAIGAGGGGASIPPAGPPTGPGGGPAPGLQAQFTVTGRFQTDAAGLAQFVRELAGPGADVQVTPDLGLVTVRGQALALARVGQFLNRYVAMSMRRVEVEASIVEVTLTDEFRYGIDWTRVLAGGTRGSVSLLGAAGAGVPGAAGLAASVVQGSIAVVLRALQQYTTVRVISQPRVLAMNNTPSVIFDGQQLPYIPGVAATIVPGAAGGTTTTSASAAFAVDGVTLSLQPDILSDTEVQLTIVPVLSRVQEFQTFELGAGSRVTAPVQRTHQSLMQVVARSGSTLILGGIRSAVGDDTRGGLPGLVDVPVAGGLLSRSTRRTSTREVVVLLRATVIPAGSPDILFSEAL